MLPLALASRCHEFLLRKVAAEEGGHRPRVVMHNRRNGVSAREIIMSADFSSL